MEASFIHLLIQPDACQINPGAFLSAAGTLEPPVNLHRWHSNVRTDALPSLARTVFRRYFQAVGSYLMNGFSSGGTLQRKPAGVFSHIAQPP
jgi:hypothetical protein